MQKFKLIMVKDYPGYQHFAIGVCITPQNDEYLLYDGGLFNKAEFEEMGCEIRQITEEDIIDCLKERFNEMPKL